MTSPMPQPARSRPALPFGYGSPTSNDGLPDDDGLLDWAQVEDRLVAAEHYWLASVRPDGRPHTIPRWGVWMGGRFYYDGSPATRHARNLDVNPACTLNLEDGKHAVIVEGTSVATRADPDRLGQELAQAFTKYHGAGYAPGPDAWAGEDGGGLRVLAPRTVFAWSDNYPADATRFTF